MPPQASDVQSAAEWIQAARKEAGLTQEEVVQRLRTVGLAISRGHFASLEHGRGLKPDHVVALDHLFHAGGALIAVAESEWGQSISSSRLEAWARLGEGIHQDWVELAESVSSDRRSARSPDREVFGAGSPAGIGELQEWWSGVQDGDVVETPERIEAAVFYLLTLARDEPRPELRHPIQFCGPFEGFRKAGRKAGLPHLVREAVRMAMEKGWECRHYIPMHPEDVESTTLVYVASPLIACRRFHAMTVDLSRASVVENLLVIPGYATVQFFATGNARRIDAAVIHKRPETRRVIEERVKQIASVSEGFDVTRFERRHDAEVTSNEVEFQRLLRGVDAKGGNCFVLAGDFPSSSIPPEAYAAGIRARRTAARRRGVLQSEDVWADMAKLQEGRTELLAEQLEHGLRHQIIITDEALKLSTSVERTPDDDYTKVYLPKTSLIAHLKHVRNLMNEYPDVFEVGIANPDLAARIMRCKWQVRDRGTGGTLVVHTDHTPQESRLLPSEHQRSAQVDLKIESDAAVKAFTAFFREVWSTKTETDPDTVKGRIERAIDIL